MLTSVVGETSSAVAVSDIRVVALRRGVRIFRLVLLLRILRRFREVREVYRVSVATELAVIFVA